MATEEEIRAVARVRLRAQLDVIEAANPGEVAWHVATDDGEASEDLSDFKFLYDPATFLVRAGREQEVNEALRSEYLIGDPPIPDDDPDLAALDLVRFPLPSRRDGERAQVLQALDLIDAEFDVPDTIDQSNTGDLERVVASPDHWLHVCPVGNGRICPAIEPKVTEETKPWPRRATDLSLGSGVRVSVVDSGWHPDAALDEDTLWLAGVDGDDENNGQVLREYAGHGTFVAGVIKCFAPAAKVHVEGFLGTSGVIRESRMVTQLGQALAAPLPPHIINLSAGSTSRKNRPLLSFERFFNKRLSQLEGTCVLVAAAGNEGVVSSFWPASFGWALGVGSLNHSGNVSGFSNFGDSAEVYAVGRDIVNAFPTGSYTYREPPMAPSTTEFNNGLARWSGTSFSAPMVAGLIAAELTGHVVDVPTARQTVMGMAQPAPGPGGITVQALPIPPP